MKEQKKPIHKGIILYALLLVVVGIVTYYFMRPRIERSAFQPVNPNEYQGKTVADYFVEHLEMDPEEAKKAAARGASFYITKGMTLDAMISNLHYYGMVKDEKAFRYVLENANDTHPAEKPDPFNVGKNDIDRGVYGLGADMSAEQIAQILVNYPQEIKTDYGNMFMPGGPYMGEPQLRPNR